MSRVLDFAPHALLLLLAICTVAMLSACGASPPQPPAPTVIAAAVEAADDLNPDSIGRASPVVLRVYELKTLAAFETADFFSLWDRDNETLGPDLVAREEIQLRPGERRTFERTLQPDTAHVAVIAAFRDLERARWRGAMAVVPNLTQPVVIKLESRSVSILPN